jgi:Cys-rich protein (TIGR01571 family)
MAQVLTRLKLDMFANPTPSDEWRMTFKRILILVVCYFIFYTIFSPPSPGIEVDDEGKFIVIPVDCPSWQRALYSTGSTLFGIYTLIVLMKTRAAVRARYSIPEQRCHGMEDCCCAFWCGCCTVAQVARQTANYHQQRAVCCSDTGLPHSMEPAIIV